MEAQPSSDGYQIKNSRIPILLALRAIDSLKPHEETVPEHLDQLESVLRHDPVLRHPIVCDKKTGLVLDGTHRLAALTRLGCQLAPCALIDYQDAKIRVDRWFRTVEGLSLERFAHDTAYMKPRHVDLSAAAECLGKRSCYASLEDPPTCLVFPSLDNDPVNLARASFEIERAIRTMNLKISYVDNKIIPSSNGFVLSTVLMEKQDILSALTRDMLFPPKTTRHIIPSRPLSLGVPLAWLQETSPDQAQSRFLSHIRTKKMIRRPEGSWVGSRRYQEEVLTFE